MNTLSFFHNKVLIFIIYVLLILCLLNTSIKMLYSITSNVLGKSKYVRPTQLSFSIRTVRLFKKKLKTIFLTCLLVLFKSSLSETRYKWEVGSLYCLDGRINLLYISPYSIVVWIRD